ncbi:MAG TPA: hypothetical protein VFP34_12915 [Microlunatus sp.]|nr:hypothetical protein [Microlunatus sp.]
MKRRLAPDAPPVTGVGEEQRRAGPADQLSLLEGSARTTTQ